MKPFTSLDEARTFATGCSGPVSVMMEQKPHPSRLELPGYRIGRTFWNQTFEVPIEQTFALAPSIRYTTPTTHLHFCPACDRTWEHENSGCDLPTPGVRCSGCEETARSAEATSVMYRR